MSLVATPVKVGDLVCIPIGTQTVQEILEEIRGDGTACVRFMGQIICGEYIPRQVSQPDPASA